MANHPFQFVKEANVDQTPKLKTPRLVAGGIYETTEKSGIVHRRMVVCDSLYPGDVHRYQVADEARRDLYFHSDTAMHEEFVRNSKLIARPISPELYEALVALMEPAVDAPTADSVTAPPAE